MKGEELQRIVESKLREGKTPKEIVNDLGPDHISLRTVKYWSTMLKQKGHLRLQKPPGKPRTVRTAALTRTIKKKSKRKKPVSIRKLGRETTTPKSTVHRVLKEDLKVKAFKKRKVPKLTPEQKTKRVHFARWVLRTLLSNERKRVVFSDEKYFDLDGMYNAQNDRVWAATREEADKQGGQFRKSKFPVKVMVYMAAAATGAVKLHISKAPTLNADIYTKECLPLAKILGHKEFGSRGWWYQQDNATPHTQAAAQQWCASNLPNFFTKEQWPPNSPDLNPLDYSLWVELGASINWNEVHNKETLKSHIQAAVRKMRKEVIVNTCSKWSTRLYKILKNHGEYIP